MKTKPVFPQISHAINPNQHDVTNQQSYKSFYLPIGVAFAMNIGLSFIANPVRAETNGGENIQHYMNPQMMENTAGRASQNSKESPAVSDVWAKKTNQGEHASNSSAVGTDGMHKKVAKKSTTEKCEGFKNTASNVQATTPISQNSIKTNLAKVMKPENSNSDDHQSYQMDHKIDPVSKPADGKGKLPTFAQADVNGDHYVTKKELQNFPYLLQVFDKVDAGNDGQLEQHEYQSLKMETKREGEIS